MSEHQTLKVHFSLGSWLGLMATSAFAIVLFTLALVVYHPKSEVAESAVELPTYTPGSMRGNYQSSELVPPVNTSALNEIKHAGGQGCDCANCDCGCAQGGPCLCCSGDLKEGNRVCLPCQQQQRQPSYVVIPQSRPVVVTPAVQPTPVPARAPAAPAQVTPVATSQNSNRFHLALFLDDSAVSQTVKSWFERDKNLAEMRKSCNFEIYTADNALYRSRYSQMVPVSEFPVVLFLRPDGGHIHAAGKNMLPKYSSDLYSDLREAFEKAESVRTAPIPADNEIMRNRVYTFADDVNPSMELISQEDCPDGNCHVPPNQDRWRPGDRVRDLFNNASERSTILWASSVEIVTYALLGAVLLLGFTLVIVVLARRK